MAGEKEGSRWDYSWILKRIQAAGFQQGYLEEAAYSFGERPVVYKSKRYPDCYIVAIYQRGFYVPLLRLTFEQVWEMFSTLMESGPCRFTQARQLALLIDAPTRHGHLRPHVIKALEDYLEKYRRFEVGNELVETLQCFAAGEDEPTTLTAVASGVDSFELCFKDTKRAQGR